MYRRIALLMSMMMAIPAIAFAAGRTPAPTVATGSASVHSMKAGGYKQPVPSFSKVDSNGDHRIEWKEAKSVGVPKAIFESYDYHHDHKLTLTEWKMVKVAMVNTSSLPKTGGKSLPKIPAKVAKKIHAPAYGTVGGTVAAPKSSTGGAGGR